MAEVNAIGQSQPFLTIEKTTYNHEELTKHLLFALSVLKPGDNTRPDLSIDRLSKLTERVTSLTLLCNPKRQAEDQTLSKRVDAFFSETEALMETVQSLCTQAMEARRTFAPDQQEVMDEHLKLIREGYINLATFIETIMKESSELKTKLKARIVADKGLNLTPQNVGLLDVVFDNGKQSACRIQTYHAITDRFGRLVKEIDKFHKDFCDTRERLAFEYNWTMATIHHYNYVPTEAWIISMCALGHFNYFSGIAMPKDQFKVSIPNDSELHPQSSASPPSSPAMLIPPPPRTYNKYNEEDSSIEGEWRWKYSPLSETPSPMTQIQQIVPSADAKKPPTKAQLREESLRKALPEGTGGDEDQIDPLQ